MVRFGKSTTRLFIVIFLILIIVISGGLVYSLKKMRSMDNGMHLQFQIEKILDSAERHEEEFITFKKTVRARSFLKDLKKLDDHFNRIETDSTMLDKGLTADMRRLLAEYRSTFMSFLTLERALGLRAGQGLKAEFQKASDRSENFIKLTGSQSLLSGFEICKENAKNFFLEKNPIHIKRFEANFKKLTGELKTTEFSDVEKEQLGAALDSYKRSFTKLAKTKQALGLEKTSGLQGELYLIRSRLNRTMEALHNATFAQHKQLLQYNVLATVLIILFIGLAIFLFIRSVIINERLIREIADREKAEHETQAVETTSQAILSAIPDIMFMLDEKGTFLDFHAKETDELLFPPEEFLGKRLSDLMPDISYMAMDHLEKALLTKKIEIFAYTREVSGEEKSYEARMVSHWPHQVLVIIRDITAQKRAEQMMMRDKKDLEIQVRERTLEIQDTNLELRKEIKERKTVENALRRSEELFRTIFESSPDSVQITRIKDNRYIDSNTSFSSIFGFSKEDVVGLTVDDLDFFANDGQREEFFRQLDETGSVQNLEVELITKTGGRKSCLVSANIVDIDDEPHVISIARDIEDLKNAQKENQNLEAQLQQAQKMEAIGTLAGGIAHDFNNLLMAILGRISILINKAEPEEPHVEHLIGVEQLIHTGAGLTKRLLGFAGGHNYEVQPVNVKSIVENQIRLFGRTRKEITIQESHEKNLWAAEADKSQVEQVLLNLFVNASQAMPSGGSLFVRTYNADHEQKVVQPYGLEPGRYVVISVADTGSGMSSETLRKIFDPFFTTKGKGIGTGLGLASVYRIIKNHKGFITVSSEEDLGSTFNVHLPASSEKVEEEPEASDSLSEGSGTLLLVDDEDAVLEVSREMAESLGYKVIVAKSGLEAVDRFKENPDSINLVILDMVMPIMSGLETFDKLKEIKPDVKVLVMSGYSLDAKVGQILKKGGKGFLEKPFGLIQFSNKIHEVMSED